MNKTILILIALMVICVGMVTATDLGPELVTCGDFTCTTNWIGFQGVVTGNGWYSAIPPGFAQDFRSTDLGISYDLNQSDIIEAGKTYNATINVYAKTGGNDNNLTIFLGDAQQEIAQGVTITSGNNIFSYLITTINGGDLVLRSNITISNPTYTLLNNVSIREVIPPTPPCSKILKFKGNMNPFGLKFKGSSSMNWKIKCST